MPQPIQRVRQTVASHSMAVAALAFGLKSLDERRELAKWLDRVISDLEKSRQQQAQAVDH